MHKTVLVRMDSQLPVPGDPPKMPRVLRPLASRSRRPRPPRLREPEELANPRPAGQHPQEPRVSSCRNPLCTRCPRGAAWSARVTRDHQALMS